MSIETAPATSDRYAACARTRLLHVVHASDGGGVRALRRARLARIVLTSLANCKTYIGK
jgi:hypothetical protein